MNVAFSDIPISGISTSQAIVLLLSAFTLLALATLLWMNHRAQVAQAPILVLQQIGALCPVDPAERPFLTIPVRMPARAPPTFHSLSITTPTPGSTAHLPGHDGFVADSAD